MTNFNLINIDGKPIQKLIEVMSNAIGTLYKPNAIRKEADAEAYRIKTIGRAQALTSAEIMKLNWILMREFNSDFIITVNIFPSSD
jgi:hypothetical protein